MKTQIFTYTEIEEAAKLLEKGELVAFPTETVYGLWANALDASAAEKIYKAKWRPSDNPLIVHIASFQDIETIARIPQKNYDAVKKLADTFWPGPLTIILPKKPCIPDAVSWWLDTVALRIPRHRSTLKLIRLAGFPIAGPSANISGKPSSTRFSHVLHDFDGKIAGIIRSKSCQIGVESSVIDMSGDIPVLLRPGWIDFESLKEILPHISESYEWHHEIARSPGMKYMHYTPQAELILFELWSEEQIKTYQKKYKADWKKVRKISLQHSKKIAKDLFHLLRESDIKGYDVILIAWVDESGIWKAVMNRLRKAATHIIS